VGDRVPGAVIWFESSQDYPCHHSFGIVRSLGVLAPGATSRAGFGMDDSGHSLLLGFVMLALNILIVPWVGWPPFEVPRELRGLSEGQVDEWLRSLAPRDELR
jgi:hypothetical protein